MKKSRGMKSAAVACTVLAGSLTTMVVGAGEASARCDVSHYDVVEQLGPAWFTPIGSRAGKFNSSPSTGTTLSYARATTVTKTTTWKAEAGGSVGWGIGKVEAKIGRDVASSFSAGVTVTNTMVVPPKKYGYTEPKAEYRRYAIYQYRLEPNCKGKYIKTWGTLDAIVTVPFFAECIAAGPCTPKP